MEIIASEFKAKCLHLMDQVALSGESIIITKHGNPIAQLSPIKNKPKTLFGAFKDEIQIHKDVTLPLDIKWNAIESNEDDTI